MRLKILIPPFIISVLTIFFYWPSLHYAFQFDDNLAILKHFNIRNAHLSKVFFSGTRWIGDWINALNFQINRFDPFVFRTTNLIIHIITSILLFYALYRMLLLVKEKNFFSENAFSISLMTGLLFALHPVQTQTVSYIIQGRLEGLSALFILSAIICFLALTQTTIRAVQYTLALVLFILVALACGSKEISIVTPFLILLVDWFFVAQGTWTSLKKRMILHATTLGITGAIFWYFKRKLIIDAATGVIQVYNNIGNILTYSAAETIKPWPFFLSQFKVILHYIWIFIWPFNISVEYDWKLVPGFFSLDCLIPFLALIAIGSFIIWKIYKNKTSILAFALLWFFICIAPRSTLIPSAELLVDYKTYLASVGILLLLSAGIIKLGLQLIKYTSLYKKKQQTELYLFITAIALFLGFLTYQRNKVWQTSLSFWENVIKHAPNKARVFNNYGIALIEHGHYQKAISYLKQALRLQKGNYWDPYTNISIAYAGLGKTDLAIQAIKRALSINPMHVESYNSLGLLFKEQKKWYDAEKSFQAAITLRPHYGKAFFNLGLVHLEQENFTKAWECFKDCCTKGDLDTCTDGFLYYARTSMHLKKFDHAITAYKKILELQPDDPNSMLNLANAYLFNDNIEYALQVYEQMAQKYPNDFRPLANSAQIYLSGGEPNKALAPLKQALQVKGAPIELELKLARCLEQLGQKTAAQKIIRRLAEQNDDQIVKNKAMHLLE